MNAMLFYKMFDFDGVHGKAFIPNVIFILYNDTYKFNRF